MTVDDDDDRYCKYDKDRSIGLKSVGFCDCCSILESIFDKDSELLLTNFDEFNKEPI